MIQYAKTNPVGVDIWIGKFQTQQQRELPTLFGVSEAKCLFYGRSELSDGKQIVFISGIDYEPVDFSTDYYFISYFTMKDENFTGEVYNANMEFYCHGDLSKIFSSVTHRADEYFRKAMKDFILKRIEPAEFVSIEEIERLQSFQSFKINFVKHYQ